MVVIDAGHGGWDPGGGSNSQFKEKNMTFRISNYQYNRLRELGFPAERVRKNDETLTPKERIDRINGLCCPQGGNNIFISNHINTGCTNPGAEVIYSLRNSPTLAKMIGDELRKTGTPIRDVYTKRGKTGKDFYFVLRDTPQFTDSMIIEYGCANIPTDSNRIIYQWPVLAEAVVKAIADYSNVRYTPPTYAIHIVRPGESLFTIAQKYNVSVDRIIRDNDLPTAEVFPGQQLVINF